MKTIKSVFSTNLKNSISSFVLKSPQTSTFSSYSLMLLSISYISNEITLRKSRSCVTKMSHTCHLHRSLWVYLMIVSQSLIWHWLLARFKSPKFISQYWLPFGWKVWVIQGLPTHWYFNSDCESKFGSIWVNPSRLSLQYLPEQLFFRISYFS